LADADADRGHVYDAINPELETAGLPAIDVRLGLDAGEAAIVVPPSSTPLPEVDACTSVPVSVPVARDRSVRLSANAADYREFTKVGDLDRMEHRLSGPGCRRGRSPARVVG
jgi:hypothetical protein